MGKVEATRWYPAQRSARGPLARLGLLGAVGLIVVLELASVTAAQPITSTTTSVVVAVPPASPTLILGAGEQPGSICALNSTACGQSAESRVQLAVTAETPLTTWPAVEVAFVIETDAFDGVYDPVLQKLPPGGTDPCVKAVSNGPLCEESNGVPFFEDYMGEVTQQIASDNPHTSVSFAMLDYQGTCDQWDDGCYEHFLVHVDVPDFQSANDFSQSANEAFKESLLGGGYVLSGEDLADPFLHISSITALYGALNGDLFNWTPNTHHVIIWMGSAAPRDPSFAENYCVSSSAWETYYYWGSSCIAPTCEPSHEFSNGFSPNCEGWVRSQDGNPSDSIAALAHQAPQCVQSTGGSCTIDVIDLLDTPTDPLSEGWPKGTTGGGPGGSIVEQDSTNILLAGCDMAQATGGSWDGPIYFSCPDGQAGGLQYVPHGPVYTPTTWNPTLMNAFRTISFGPVSNPVVAVGTEKPMFNFVPFGAIAVAWNPDYATSCSTPSGFSSECPTAPTISTSSGVRSYGWNWSTNSSLNELKVGDTWLVSFNVVNTGPPYKAVPVDACTTPTCGAAGSGAIGGIFTSAIYSVPNETGIIVQSFPLAEVLVVTSSTTPTSPPPPTPPPVGSPAVPVPLPSTVSNPVLVIVTVQTSLGSFSTQSIAGGLLAAVFTRVMIKQRPMAVAQAVMTGNRGSKFDAATPTSPGIGRME
jgi:hypothetical protein